MEFVAGEINSYNGMHRKLKEKRGRAAEYDCVDCGGQAKDWSLKAGLKFLKQCNVGVDKGRVFSSDIWSYEPRCRRCHARHDSKEKLAKADYGVNKRVRPQCTLDGCKAPHHAKGMCKIHYLADYRNKKKMTENVDDGVCNDE